MTLQFKVTAKKGAKTIAEVMGSATLEASAMTIGDVTIRVMETEQFLEKLTGLRWHIEQVA